MRAIVIDPPSAWGLHELADDDIAVIVGRSPQHHGLSAHLELLVSARAIAPNPLASALLSALGLPLVHLRGTAVIRPTHQRHLSQTTIDVLIPALETLAANEVLLQAHTAAIRLSSQWAHIPHSPAALS